MASNKVAEPQMSHANMVPFVVSTILNGVNVPFLMQGNPLERMASALHDHCTNYGWTSLPRRPFRRCGCLYPAEIELFMAFCFVLTPSLLSVAGLEL
jgi:hypothetical protein